MYKDKFVVSIIHDGHPVKETGPKYGRRAAIPFNDEYKIRLKNKNDRSCTARVFVDGKKVSQLGDFIIHAGGSVDLERYVTESLTNGKKFKFVSLNHEDVDDPTDFNNGIIKVEFRLAKHRNGIKINWDQWNWNNWYVPGKFPEPYKKPPFQWYYYTDNATSGGGSANNITCNSSSLCSFSNMDMNRGATVEGGDSIQSFSYSNIDVEEDACTTLKLQLVGLKKDNKVIDKKYRYCTRCGNKVRRVDKYCAECGSRL